LTSGFPVTYLLYVPRIRPGRRAFEILLAVAFAFALAVGIALGLALADTRNISEKEQFASPPMALPTKVLDIHDRLITEFFGDQNREPVSLDKVPQYLIDALLTREDRNFFSEPGFSIRGMLRAVFNIVTGQYISGASTLTQQLAGRLHTNRADISIRRKLVELWWAIQMERRYTKQEILQMYLNEMPFGANTQGVQAASKFFFNHPVQQDTLAESVMLVIQLAKPGLYSPIRNPERARKLQRVILDQMVSLGYVTKEQADSSFNDYWSKYDYTRPDTTAYFERQDKAPWFSEYIRGQLEDMLGGTYNILTDGLVVHTTLNLDDQKVAQERMTKDIEAVNNQYLDLTKERTAQAGAALQPMMEMLGLTYNIDDMMYHDWNASGNAKRLYTRSINPVVEMVTSLFSMRRPEDIVRAGDRAEINVSRRTQVQGALISIDPSNGYILAMVGGKQFGVDQFNRAVQARVEPGSAFKPLYYSAAIDSRKFTPATMILDAPVVFTNPDGTLYEPLNYKGEWHGRVLLRQALAHSMNVPSLKILDGIGFDAAIDRASRMLGITDPAEIEKTFPRYYPLGLGVISVSPLQMARAYSVFANGGREVVPVAIRYVEDRNGKVILEPAKKIMDEEARKGDAAQIMSPQTAYIMTSLLQSVIKEGSLGGVGNLLDIWSGKSQPYAGKTGTTQNWSDAWTVGFSPYMCTAVWYGFDDGHRSLGTELTGAAIAGPTWAKYMKAVHQNLPIRQFDRPQTGLVDVEVSATSGLLPTAYTQKTIDEIFLAGTQPTTFDEIDEYNAQREQTIEENLRNSLINTDMAGGDIGTSPDTAPAPAANPPTPQKGNPLLN
jgi:penicillin-binding protein 1A